VLPGGKLTFPITAITPDDGDHGDFDKVIEFMLDLEALGGVSESGSLLPKS